MASSDNLMTVEQPWMFRSNFGGDAWISDIFTKENDALAKALQKSFAAATTAVDYGSGGGDVTFSAEMVESLFAKPDITPIQTPSASGGSENDAPAPKPRRNAAALPPTGRVSKRKSRASKRATTTFITADPANFRQMVQQVTGVRFDGFNGQLAAAPVLKPEPYRPLGRLQPCTGLPTLDTSSFLLDGGAGALAAPPPPAAVGDGGAAAAGLDFDSFCSFPTLESWKVM